MVIIHNYGVSEMKILDAHAHYYDIPDYLSQLITIMDQNNIEKTCLSGLGKLFSCKENSDVKKAMEQYPTRIIGNYYIRPGMSSTEEIENAYNNGFRMLKVTLPTAPYNDPSFFPLWGTAEQLSMPILFHTGIVTTSIMAPEEQISSWNMHPMRLEPIANAFPNLKIIIAHMGVHWNDDAAELARMRGNVYLDLTGEPTGWRVRLDQIGLKKFLWWENAFEKIIFGTDVLASKIQTILHEDLQRYKSLNISQQTQELIFHGNIEKLLGLIENN